MNTQILCPSCLDEFLYSKDNLNAECNNCGTTYTIIEKNTVRYNNIPKPYLNQLDYIHETT